MEKRILMALLLTAVTAVSLTTVALADVISGGAAVAAAGEALLPWLLVGVIGVVTIFLLRRRKK